MGGGSNWPPLPQHILVFKFPSRDRVKGMWKWKFWFGKEGMVAEMIVSGRWYSQAKKLFDYVIEFLMVWSWMCCKREGVQSIHEPCKLTSGVSWFAEWSPSQLLANQNRLWASCYVWQAAQLSLTSSIMISNNKYLAFTSTKSLFRKISTCS